MGMEVEAFLGPVEALRGWMSQLQYAMVYSLNPQLGLVPATGDLLQELRERSQATAETDRQVAERWGGDASRACTIAYFTAYEFGDDGSESAVVWTGGQVVGRPDSVAGALELREPSVDMREIARA